jgi:fructose/tagatose bisphosphate aldolase
VSLVLHGGSGVPDDQVREAVRLGISKVNVATEIKNIFMQHIKKLMRDTEEIDLRKVFPPATEAVKNLVVNKLKLVSLHNPSPCQEGNVLMPASMNPGRSFLH